MYPKRMQNKKISSTLKIATYPVNTPSIDEDSGYPKF
jgi:hypothetical protein